MANLARIAKCRIDKPLGFLSTPTVWVTYEGYDKEHELFKYYPDEISFTPDELIGLTKEEAVHLKFEKDKAYLQS